MPERERPAGGASEKAVEATVSSLVRPYGRVFYFGCRNGDVGHFMFEPGMRRPPAEYARHPYPGLPWDEIDGAFAPRKGTGRRAPELRQGVAALHHKDGWTALSFWDRSVDSRGMSSSTFIFDAELDFEQALAAAREHFPTIVARYPFEIVQAAHA